MFTIQDAALNGQGRRLQQTAGTGSSYYDDNGMDFISALLGGLGSILDFPLADLTTQAVPAAADLAASGLEGAKQVMDALNLTDPSTAAEFIPLFASVPTQAVSAFMDSLKVC